MANLPTDVEEDLALDEVDGFFPSVESRPKAFEKLRGVGVPCSDQIDSGVFTSVSDDGYNSSNYSGLDNVQILLRGLQVTDSCSNEVITDSISLNKVRSAKVATHDSTCHSRNENSSSPVQESCSVVPQSVIDETVKNRLKDLDRFDSGCCSESIDLFPRSEIREIVEPTNLNSEEYAIQFYQPDEDGDTDLHNSIILNGEISMQLISIAPTYEWLNFQNRLSQTPLHLAVLTNQPEIVRRLIVGGAQIDIRDHKGNTPLHIAAQKGYQNIAKLLLTPVFHNEINVNSYEIPYQKIPQDLEIRNYDGLSCLHLAALGNHYDSMRLLLENRAPINIADGKSGRTILHYAAEQGNEDLLHFILSSPNTDINKKTYGGLTAIALANGRGYNEAVRILYRNGADTTGLDENQDDSDEEMDTMYDDIEINGERVFT